MAKYSNLRAMRALVIASLQAIIKSPSAVVFTIAFPLIFIVVFGFLGGEGGFSIKVAPAHGSDTTSQLYSVLRKIPVLKWTTGRDSAALQRLLQQGDIAATLDVRKQPAGVYPEYKVFINAASSEQNKAIQLENIINELVLSQDPEIKKRAEMLLKTDMKVAEVREYKAIDFILPGQLSFSLMASSVFGTAFVFFNMKQTLVLKRFFATPVRRGVIVISEALSRLLFQLLGSAIIITIGHFAFGFTLAHGIITLINLLALCALGLLMFMGFGFIISSLAKSEGAIPPFSNIVTLPQFLLAGTFFSIENFPKWLQPLCRALPLTYLNDALRRVSFEGASLWTVRTDIFVLTLWGLGIYALAVKVFKWE